MLMLNNRERKVIKLQLSKEQKALEDLERQYKQALKDIDEKIKLLQSDELTQSRIYQIQYQKALRGQIEGILDKLQGDEYATIQQYLHDSYQDGFIGTMYSLHGQGIPLILPLDQDAAVKAIITDSKLSDDLYKELGVNVKQLKQAISSEITRGIASNMPFADIARNIANRSKAPLARAKTIVRTEGHRIQEASAEDARQALKARGCDVVKQWTSLLDGDTRSTHRRLDGQIVELEGYFILSATKKARYPGDFGKAEEDCNCRCKALTRPRWELDEEELQVLKDRAEFFGLDKSRDFEDFEKKYLKAAESQAKTAETLDKSGKSGIIDMDKDGYYQSLTKEQIATRYVKSDGSNLLDDSFLQMSIDMQRETIRGYDKAISLFGGIEPQRIKAGRLPKGVFAEYSSVYKTITFNPYAKDALEESFGTMIHEMTHHAETLKLFDGDEVLKVALKQIGLRFNSKEAANLRQRTVGVFNTKDRDNAQEIIAYALERHMRGSGNALTTAIYNVLKGKGVIK